MDFLESLGKQISEITVYDVKSAYEKAKNVVMNYTEMEAKVREATNGDAWGASSTLMSEIAQGTFSFAEFNQIMPVIYSRFSEKEASEWRQIYKALTLLEYLVKHGSERVVDDARSHLSMIKMLRNFHYIDEKGKDQGINVRNRSKELAELLSDLDRVRQERRKARQNKTKYTGVGNDGFGGSFGAGPSFTSTSGSRYGGFSSDSYHASQGSGFGEPNPVSDFARTRAGASASTRRDSFEEYDAGDDDDRKAGTAASSSSRNASRSSAPAPIKKDTPTMAQPKKEVNLFDFDDDEPAAPAPAPAPAAPAHNRTTSFDDDFDDFQSANPAAPAPAQASVPSTQQSSQSGGNFFDMMGGSAPLRPASASATTTSSFTSPPMQARQQQQPRLQTSHNMPAGPNYSGVGLFQSTSSSNSSSTPGHPGRPRVGGHSMSSSSLSGGIGAPSSPSKPGGQQAGKPSGSSAAFDFDDLFAAAGAKSSSSSSTKAGGPNSIASLAAQKQSSQLWGATSSGNAPSSSSNKANDDLLF